MTAPTEHQRDRRDFIDTVPQHERHLHQPGNLFAYGMKAAVCNDNYLPLLPKRSQDECEGVHRMHCAIAAIESVITFARLVTEVEAQILAQAAVVLQNNLAQRGFYHVKL